MSQTLLPLRHSGGLFWMTVESKHKFANDKWLLLSFIQSKTLQEKEKMLVTVFSKVFFRMVVLTLSFIYTHFNTLKKNALGKHCGKR